MPLDYVNASKWSETSAPRWVLVGTFILIAAIKYGQWNELPYWDAAFSVFPAAITLAETNFDYVSLYHADRFSDGGPNVHACSIVTLLTAVVFKLTPSSSVALLVLHFLHYVAAAATIRALYIWSLPLLGCCKTVILCINVLLFPLFMTQAGHMYLEIPGALAVLMALNAFQSGHLVRCSLWAAVAVSVKEPGIIAAATLGFGALLIPGSNLKKCFHSAAIIAPSAIILGATMLFYSSKQAKIHSAASVPSEMIFSRYIHIYDLLAIIVLTAIITAIGIPHSVRTITAPSSEKSSFDWRLIQRRLLTRLIVGMFFLLYLTLTLLNWTIVLPRYSVAVLPLMILMIVDSVNCILGSRFAAAFLTLGSLVSLVNYNGTLYPYTSGNDGSAAERSNEYTHMLATHVDVMTAAASVPEDTYVFHGLPEKFFNSYPGMGYVEHSHGNLRYILGDLKYSDANIEDFPNDFCLIISFAALGGDKLNWLKSQALSDTNYSVISKVFRHSVYQSQIIYIKRKK